MVSCCLGSVTFLINHLAYIYSIPLFGHHFGHSHQPPCYPPLPKFQQSNPRLRCHPSDCHRGDCHFCYLLSLAGTLVHLPWLNSPLFSLCHISFFCLMAAVTGDCPLNKLLNFNPPYRKQHMKIVMLCLLLCIQSGYYIRYTSINDLSE